jgi:hypothetical protein
MSLESKAKTTFQLEIESSKSRRTVRVCKYAEIPEATLKRDAFLNQKWVPLEEWLTLNSQVKELTEKLVEALSDADKRIGIHKQEAQKLEADRDGAEALSHAIQEERNKLGVLLLKTLKEACNYENKMEAKIAEAKKILLEECYRCLAKSERNPLKEKCRDLCRTWRVREVLL